MNILFVNSTRGWGGVKTWSIDMARALAGLGHETALVGRPGPFVDKTRKLGIKAEAHDFGFDFNPASIAFFLKLYRELETDVVICNISKGLRTAGAAARLAGIPIVHRLGSPGDVSNRLKTRLTQRLLRPGLIACSEYVRQKLLVSVPVYRDYPFEAIFPGATINPVPPGSVNTPRVIIATSQLNPDKNHIHLLEALAALMRDGYDFRCIIAGTGRDEAMLKQSCGDMGLNGRVEWTGFITDVAAQLRRADIFVLPTGCEPLGIALEEAMANGLVPVSRNIGGPTEIWHPGHTDLLVDPEGGGPEFRDVLARLLDMPDNDLLALKREFHAHAGRTFSLDGQAKHLAAWLERFIAGRGGRRKA
ncbi:MAG: glycosyltransferase [Pseudodesulfovibrio sp.]|uniref:glycosyltransferase n=1 Tax=Pseudodesulfovibrio sp. TaxID=2035812 RepID=UPI003D0FA4A3